VSFLSLLNPLAGADNKNHRQEGFHAFYKGITPRIMRVAPGQAVTFTVYEYLKDKLEKSAPGVFAGGRYEE
jgi:solute carrier family 25 citrate transporter 1